MNTAAVLDSVIESFERKRLHDRSVSLRDFLPPVDTADFSQVLTELIRVDLEYSWAEGQPHSLDDYLTDFPQIQDDRQALSAIAFEEYRLRQQAGESPSAAEYHRRYRINTRDWPVTSTLVDLEDQPTLPSSPPHRTATDARNHSAGSLDEEWPGNLPDFSSSFPDFVLESELGQGAFGKVYLARQKSLANRKVALKLTSRKQHEPQVLAKLRHTNIMPIYSVHPWGQGQALCMPYLGKQTFADILHALRKADKLPTTGAWWSLLIEGPDALTITTAWKNTSHVAVVLHLAEKMVAGLAHAHACGIVHRDIKPANILLSHDGEPLLLDFNLAVEIDEHASMAAMAGTLPYLAPEQLDAIVKGQGTTGTKQADVYAIGLILYELLAGQPAYPLIQSDSLLNYVAGLAKQRRVLPVSLRSINPAVSPALAAMIEKCLAFSVNARYVDARALLEDLERQRRDQVLRYAPDVSWRERWGKWNRRHPTFIRNSLLAGLFLLAMTAGVSVYRQYDSERRLSSRTQFLRAQDTLQRADRLATAIWPTKLSEASKLVDQIIDSTPGMRQSSPASLLQQSGARYLDDAEQRQLPAFIARTYLLQARILELLAVRAGSKEDRNKLHHNALAANAAAQPWSQAAGFGSISHWQQSFLNNQKWEEDWKTLLNSPRDSLPARELAGLAYILLDQQHWQQAATLARQVIDREPGWSGAWFLYGLVYARGGQLLQALHGFDTALALQPSDPVALHYRGKVRLQLADSTGALDDLEKALALDAPGAEVQTDRALVYLQLRQPKDALAALDQALAGDSNQARLYFQRARVKAMLGDAKGAAEDRQLGLVTPPRDEIDYVSRGIARREQHDWLGALEEFKKAEQLSPAYLPSLENQSEILGEQLNKPAEALAVLNRAIERIPESSLLYASRAVYHARLGHRTEALKDVASAQKHDAMPQPLTLYQIGCVYALTSKIHAADLFQALAFLSLALEKQFGKEYLASDADLNPIRTRPEFQELLKRYVK